MDQQTKQEMMEEAKAFWASPIGKQRIREARDRENPILKKNDDISKNN
jgi:hypothetical protein